MIGPGVTPDVTWEGPAPGPTIPPGTQRQRASADDARADRAASSTEHVEDAISRPARASAGPDGAAIDAGRSSQRRHDQNLLGC